MEGPRVPSRSEATGRQVYNSPPGASIAGQTLVGLGAIGPITVAACRCVRGCDHTFQCGLLGAREHPRYSPCALLTTIFDAGLPAGSSTCDAPLLLLKAIYLSFGLILRPRRPGPIFAARVSHIYSAKKVTSEGVSIQRRVG